MYCANYYSLISVVANLPIQKTKIERVLAVVRMRSWDASCSRFYTIVMNETVLLRRGCSVRRAIETQVLLTSQRIR